MSRQKPYNSTQTSEFISNMCRYPGEVEITEIAEGDGASTPATDAEDDFFSSWDKPAIKRPTPPISRTATPVLGRTPSPFLNAGAKDAARSGSPLSRSESTEGAKPASRITTSANLRKSTTASGPRKTSVLGAKKTTSKLGVKKVTGDLIDFDEAEKKAKEEADRIAKLGYDPDAEDEQPKAAAGAATILSPTPVSAAAATSSHSRKPSDQVERLGMNVQRLGFGQIGGAKAAAAPAAKKNAGGFGSVGPVKATAAGLLPLSCHHLPTS